MRHSHAVEMVTDLYGLRVHWLAARYLLYNLLKKGFFGFCFKVLVHPVSCQPREIILASYPTSIYKAISIHASIYRRQKTQN